MAVSETAELIATLKLINELSGPAAAATADVEKLDTTTAGATARASKFSGVTKTAGDALGHFKTRVTDVAKVVGAAGLFGGGIAALEFLKGSIQKGEQFVEVSDRLAQLTGRNVQETSKWSDALDYFNIQGDAQLKLVGFLQKSIGMLATQQGGAKKVQQDYGFAIKDSTGHLKSAQQIFTDFIDYYNTKGIPVQEKAALGAKLFGRSWQQVLPIIEAGGKAWKDAVNQGMELTPQQVADAHKMRDAQREWNDAIGDLQTQIGIAALPALADLAHAAGQFVNQHQQDFVDFFKRAIEFGRQFAGFVANEVVPTIGNLVDGAQKLWNGIPGPLKDLLIKGFVADRTVKFLFGIDLAGLAKDAIGGIIGGGIKGVLGGLFTRGGPGNPMYVVAEGGLGGGGLGGATGGGGGLAGKLGSAVSIIGAVSIAATSLYLLAQQFNQFLSDRDAAQAALQEKSDAASQQTATDALQNLKNLNSKLGSLQGLDRIIGDTFGGKQEAEALSNLADSVTHNGHLTAAQITDAISTLQAAQVQATARGNTQVASHIGEDIATLQARLSGQGSTQNGLLQQIANQPTQITIPVSTTVNASVSVRDTSSSITKFNRYGYSVA